MEPVSTVAKVASLSLATLISLSQWFSDGITEYQKKNYDKAAAAFSKVIEEKVKPNPLYESSLYWRSQCFAQLKKTNEAAADLVMLLEKAPEGQLATLAAEDLKQLTGREMDSLGQATPEEAWASMCRAIRKHDLKAVMRCLTGEIAVKTARMFEEENAEKNWKEMAEILGAKVTGISYNKDKSRAIIFFREREGSTHEEKGLMEKEGGKWRLAGEAHSKNEENEFGATSKPAPPTARGLTGDEQKEIEALIIQLGSSDARERKTAYDKLRSMGAKTAGLLEKARTNPDPEIAAQAKKLLSEL